MISKDPLIFNLPFNKRSNRNPQNLPITLRSKPVNTWIGKDLSINWLQPGSLNLNLITSL